MLALLARFGYLAPVISDQLGQFVSLFHRQFVFIGQEESFHTDGLHSARPLDCAVRGRVEALLVSKAASRARGGDDTARFPIRLPLVSKATGLQFSSALSLATLPRVIHCETGVFPHHNAQPGARYAPARLIEVLDGWRNSHSPYAVPGIMYLRS